MKRIGQFTLQTETRPFVESFAAVTGKKKKDRWGLISIILMMTPPLDKIAGKKRKVNCKLRRYSGLFKKDSLPTPTLTTFLPAICSTNAFRLPLGCGAYRFILAGRCHISSEKL